MVDIMNGLQLQLTDNPYKIDDMITILYTERMNNYRVYKEKMRALTIRYRETVEKIDKSIDTLKRKKALKELIKET